MSTIQNTSIRKFWVDVLARASTSELAEMVDTLTARHAADGCEADSDLLVLARRTLQRRRMAAGGQDAAAGEVGGADPAASAGCVSVARSSRC